jgi:DNA-binding NtrC family response regulator
VKAVAFDVLEKPIDGDLLLDKIDKARRQHTLLEENGRLRQQLLDGHPLEGVIGTSEPMRHLFELVACVAPSEANVLIQGENGTGKELIANAIHAHSHRSRGPFIKVNCAALPAELIESELFGYRRGAFTGATSDKPGLFRLAQGGSLLLDEIGEMPAALQTKLLRVLQEREYRPVGGDRTLPVDCRLICATNLDVETARQDGRLREDLYFRINTVTLRVPPLRERPEDIPLLCEHFLETFRQQYQKPETSLSAPVRDRFLRSRWPGNVRELAHVIERAILVAKGPAITVDDLPEPMREASALAPEFVVPPNRTLEQIEKMAIVQALERARGNKLEAAKMLGVYRPTLYSKMKKYCIGGIDARAGAPGAAADRDRDRPVEVTA